MIESSNSNVRIVLGKKVPKEIYHYHVFSEAQSQAMNLSQVSTLEDLAWEILKNHTEILSPSVFNPPLDSATRADVLEQIASTPLFKKNAPNYAKFFRNRKVVQKFARLMTRIDEFYSDFSELSLFSEYFLKKDPELGFLVQFVSELWKNGELTPWSRAGYIRSVLKILTIASPKLSFSKLDVVRLGELTPLEKKFIDALSAHGVEISFEEDQEIDASQIQATYHHSTLDQVFWIVDQVKQGVQENKTIAIYVPQSETESVDLLVSTLETEKIYPIQSGMWTSTFWKKNVEAVFWLTFLKAQSKPGGFDVHDLRVLFSKNKSLVLDDLLKTAYQHRIFRGISSFEYLFQKNQNEILGFTLGFFKVFARARTPQDALQEFLKFLNNHFEFLSQVTGISNHEECLFLRFLSGLFVQREFLQTKKLKLRWLCSAFEEWVATEIKPQKYLSSVAILDIDAMSSHAFDQAYVMSFNRIEQKPDPSSLDELPIDIAWNVVHSLPKEEAMPDFFLNHEKLTLSGVAHDLHSSEIPKVSHPAFLKLKLPGSPDFQIHEQSGWNQKSQQEFKPRTPENRIADFECSSPVSISSFEDYLKCPYLYFARHVKKIKTHEELELALDPSAMAAGNLFHRTLQTFIEEEIQGKLNENALFSEQRLHLHFSNALKHKDTLQGLLPSKKLEKNFQQKIWARLLKWLEWESANRKKFQQLKPLAVELPFEIELAPELRVKGRIDRIDSGEDGLVICDYKSGEPPFRGADLLSGAGVQLMAYGVFAKERFKLEPAALYYLSLGRKISNSGGLFFKKFQKKLFTASALNKGLVDKSFEEILENNQKHWQKKAQELKQGIFTPNPWNESKVCSSCDFRNVCGYQKNEDQLDS